jgi:hypothetical protein
MKKLFLFAAVAGLGLVSASPPAPEDMQGSDETRTGYPPCSASVTDECNQLRERGVERRETFAENRHPGRRGEEMGMAEGDDDEADEEEARDQPRPASEVQPRPAYGGSSHYPPCTAALKDECRQHRALARRIRIAGERG